MSRRGLIGGGAALAASTVFASSTVAQTFDFSAGNAPVVPPPLEIPTITLPAVPLSPARALNLRNLNTEETWAGEYHNGTDYIPDAMRALDRLLRDRRSGDVAVMDPGVIDILFHIQQKIVERGEPAGVMGIICGYRSPSTNARMSASGEGVAVNSMHPRAKAIDIRHSGVPSRQIQQISLGLQPEGKCGGVGYYPRSNFVHVDTGRVRRW